MVKKFVQTVAVFSLIVGTVAATIASASQPAAKASSVTIAQTENRQQSTTNASVAGTWSWRCCEGAYWGDLKLYQNGNRITGTLYCPVNNSNGNIIDGTIEGDRAEFTIEYTGNFAGKKQFYVLILSPDGQRLEGTFKGFQDISVGVEFTANRLSRDSSSQVSSSTSSPKPFPDQLGSLDYYRFRNQDFVARNPNISSPDYYLNFGDKYLRRFRLEVRPNLTQQGQEFIDRVGVALQRRMEEELRSNPRAFAELERDSDKFREFAYETHVAAYCESGWRDLPLSDNQAIARSVDSRDLLRGIPTSLGISAKCGWFNDIIPSLPFPR